jgi:hypothetical protein
MKNLPAIVSLSIIATLLLLAVAASVNTSVSFALIASYVVGFACAASMVASLIVDYNSAPTLIELEVRRTAEELKRQDAEDRLAARALAQTYDDPITVNFMSTFSIRNEPPTVSLL